MGLNVMFFAPIVATLISVSYQEFKYQQNLKNYDSNVINTDICRDTIQISHLQRYDTASTLCRQVFENKCLPINHNDDFGIDNCFDTLTIFSIQY